MNKNFIDFMGQYSGRRVAVAVSGGVDSMCLLHWLASIGMDVVCLHVNHGLRAMAGTEAEYVRQTCKTLGVPCHIFEWTGDKPTAGLEAAARTARYKFMTDFCRENDIYALMVAHHADDQIETFLMNLARGSGVYGLAAMRAVSYRDGVRIVRPLLRVPRAELQGYCDSHGIKYFSDEMNADDKYMRVRVRQNRHVLGERLGISDARILLAIENLARARDVIDADVARLVDCVLQSGYAMFSESFLFDLMPDIRLKFIGTLIQAIGGDEYQPRLDALRRALDRLRCDCKFTLGHCTVRRLRGRILIVREGAKTSFRKRHEKNNTK